MNSEQFQIILIHLKIFIEKIKIVIKNWSSKIRKCHN